MSGYSCRSDVICHSSELHRPGPGKEAGFTLIRNSRALQAASRRLLHSFSWLALTSLLQLETNQAPNNQGGNSEGGKVCKKHSLLTPTHPYPPSVPGCCVKMVTAPGLLS